MQMVEYLKGIFVTHTFYILTIGMLISTIICAGGVWALLKQKVLLDANTHEVTSVEIPFFGKVKTNYPSIVAIFIGAALSYTIIDGVKIEDPVIDLEARVKLDDSLATNNLFVGAIPAKYLKTSSNLVGGVENLVSMRVNQEDEYSIVAFSLTGVVQGKPRYALVHGPVNKDDVKAMLVFNGDLTQ